MCCHLIRSNTQKILWFDGKNSVSKFDQILFSRDYCWVYFSTEGSALGWRGRLKTLKTFHRWWEEILGDMNSFYSGSNIDSSDRSFSKLPQSPYGPLFKITTISLWSLTVSVFHLSSEAQEASTASCLTSSGAWEK